MEQANEVLRTLLGIGLDSKELGVWHLALRAVIIYVVALVLVRLGHKRFMGKSTAFDVLLGVMLGSLISRAITGTAPFFPTIVGAAVLVAMHYLFAKIAFRWGFFGLAVKGEPVLLIEDGEVKKDALRKTDLSEADLRADLRAQRTSSAEEVKEARLERNGEVSVLKKKGEPKVLEIAVADGIQTVRIELQA